MQSEGISFNFTVSKKYKTKTTNTNTLRQNILSRCLYSGLVLTIIMFVFYEFVGSRGVMEPRRPRASTSPEGDADSLKHTAVTSVTIEATKHFNSDGDSQVYSHCVCVCVCVCVCACVRAGGDELYIMSF